MLRPCLANVRQPVRQALGLFAASMLFTQLAAAANTPTVISGTPAGSATVGQLYEFRPAASDADGDAIRYYIVNQPSWAAFDSASGRLSGTPTTANVGTFEAIRITASDGKSIADVPAYSIVVSVANRAPVIGGAPTTSVTAGSPYTFQPTASDPDGNALTFTIANKPLWAAFNSATGALSGTPTASQTGLYSGIRISVSDGKASTALPSFSIDVKSAAATTAVAAYSFDAGSGTTAADSSGRGNTLNLVNGPTWTQGRFGNALSFDGTNDYAGAASYNADLNLTSGFTLSAWIYPRSRSGWQVIVGKPYSSSHTAPYFDWVMLLEASTGKLGALVGCNGSDIMSNTAPALNAWTHVTVSYDGQSLRYYLNGTLDRTVLVGCTVPNGSSRAIRVGANASGQEVMNGSIDEVRIYSRAISAAEIQSDMGAGLGGGSSGGSTPPADTTAPTVSVTSPTSGATVSGTTTINATATDNIAVVGVQFRVDGVNLGSEDTTSPYAVSWTTTTATNGSHTVTAIARDAAGNQRVATNVAVTVSNTATPTNRAPTISGAAPSSITAGSAYSFQPAAVDADGDTLMFSITNKPTWATFSTTTGRLIGTATAADVGSYSNIAISVSDGKVSATLAPFSITVNQVAMGNATLTWTPPTTNTDGSSLTNLAGYRISYGTSPTSLNQLIQVPNAGATAYVVDGLSPGTWYFSLRTYTATGQESANTAVASKTVQ